jgi:predicted molibdopterin-dependent oxidoreductase YjgC
MRTTLDIDDDVLQAAKELARREGKTAGHIVSELARRGLTEARYRSSGKVAGKEIFLGFRPFARRGTIITNEMIDRLREEEVD